MAKSSVKVDTKATKPSGRNSFLIDTHCHLHDREFFSAEKAQEMLGRAFQNNVKKIICIGTDPEDSQAAHDFAAAALEGTGSDGIDGDFTSEPKNLTSAPDSPAIYWTFGIHPENAKNLTVVKRLTAEINLPKISSSLSKNLGYPAVAPIAIGEVGLDYHTEGYHQHAQIRLLEVMLQLAIDNNLPVSFHVREAFPDFFGVISNFPNLKGVVHSFSDNKKNLRKILNDTDFYVGVNGLATYSTLPMPPLERILLETDAPFLTPKPFRGIINEPGYVRAVAEWLSDQLGQDYQAIERETTKNAKQLFGF